MTLHKPCCGHIRLTPFLDCFVAKHAWECRAELAEKQLRLIDREKELLDMDQTVSTLREEVSFLIQQVAAVWHMVAGCKAFTQCTA